MRGLFLGAGASFEAGLPLVWDLTRELRNFLTESKFRAINSTMRLHGRGWPDEVVDEFVLALNDPTLHYENLLGILETGFSRPGPVQQQYHYLYSWLIELVGFLLYLRHVNNIAYIDAGLRYIDGIVGLTHCEMPLWIFSLNHDVLIECLAAKYQVELSCGFSGTAFLPLRDARGSLIGELPVETLSESDLEAGRLNFITHGSKGINLIKIHGALDVFTFNDGKDVMRLAAPATTTEEVIGALKSVQENVRLLHPERHLPVKWKAVNEIAYTDATNDMAFLRRSLLAGAFKFDPHREQTMPKVYLKIFASCLNRVGELISIGYGFGDSHINVVMRTWLEGRGDRKLVIVSPGIDAVPLSLLNLSPQIELVSSSATAYLEQFSTNALTPAEVLVRSLRAAERTLKRRIEGFA